ncbi:hypothetical protein [uncultured Helicobacter sp.]|uniref:hypothetical protein n=1 Tax=uncultured Helicobacter sp. TaxID=175537 RepID=UPI003752C2C4
MKIDNTKSNSTFTQPTQKTQTKEPKTTLIKQSTDSLPKTQAINTSAIKDSNTNIGKLQTLQSVLDSIEPKLQALQKIEDETQREQKAKELQEEVKKVMKETTFGDEKVFGVAFKDSKGEVVLTKVKLDTSLINENKRDLGALTQDIKDLKKDIKDAIASLSQDAQENAQKIQEQVSKEHKDNVLDSPIIQEKQPGKIASFFKGLGNFLKSSHDTNKLDSDRVQKLLA